jgi:hypothetical protein
MILLIGRQLSLPVLLRVISSGLFMILIIVLFVVFVGILILNVDFL